MPTKKTKNKPYTHYPSPELKSQNKFIVEDIKPQKSSPQTGVVDIELFISDMKNSNEQFKLSVTTFTKRLECAYGTFKYSQKGTIKPWELYFIAKVKRHIMALDNYPVVKQENLQYIKNYITGNKRHSKEIYEIDLSAAYWTLTYRDGWLSTEIYNEGLKLSKKIRLVALGALAKRTTTMDFNGYTFENFKLQPLSPAATVFFNATKRVSQLMNEARNICGTDTFFIWSDAIFFKGNDNLIKLKQFFKDNKINIKYFKIDSINYRNHIATVKSEDYAKRNDDKKALRPFNFKIMEL